MYIVSNSSFNLIPVVCADLDSLSASKYLIPVVPVVPVLPVAPVVPSSRSYFLS